MEETDESSILENGEDRLSSLPDVLLVEILSLLPIESAAATSALSRRWRRLWTQLTRLRFSPDDSLVSRSFDRPKEIHKLCNIIDHIFRQLTSPTIDSFLLKLNFTPAVDERENCDASLQSWIRQICGRRACEIEVSIPDESYYPYFIPLPSCVFETQSLVRLELRGWFTYDLPDNGTISLPNLKKLSMNLSDSKCNLMNLLFKSCPLLEDLYLYVDWEKNDYFVDISAQNLKRLAIEGNLVEGNQFRIDAPELEYILVATYCLSSHCFVGDLRRLLQADIIIVECYCLDDVLELLQGISSARSLYLSAFLFSFSDYLRNGVFALPIFRNLTHLDTYLTHPHGWSGLLRFLHCSPNLEVLVLSHCDGCDTKSMNWTMPDSVPKCLLNKLKSLEVEKLQGCQKELDFLGYILSNANVLKRVVLRNFDGGEGSKELKFCENLFSCLRSSVACEIIVYGAYLSVLSKRFYKNALAYRIINHTVQVRHP